MFGWFKTDNVTMSKEHYDYLISSTSKQNSDQGFKDGYKAGYNTAKQELPLALTKNIKYLVEMLEEIHCNIEIYEDGVENLLLNRQVYNGEYRTYEISNKRTIIKIEPKGYVLYGSESVVDDIKDVLTKVKGDSL